MNEMENAFFEAIASRSIDPMKQWAAKHEERVKARATIEASSRVMDALAILNSVPERPDRPATHSEDCHQYHQACLIARLKQALGGDINTTEESVSVTS